MSMLRQKVHVMSWISQKRYNKVIVSFQFFATGMFFAPKIEWFFTRGGTYYIKNTTSSPVNYIIEFGDCGIEIVTRSDFKD